MSTVRQRLMEQARARAASCGAAMVGGGLYGRGYDGGYFSRGVHGWVEKKSHENGYGNMPFITANKGKRMRNILPDGTPFWSFKDRPLSAYNIFMKQWMNQHSSGDLHSNRAAFSAGASAWRASAGYQKYTRSGNNYRRTFNSSGQHSVRAAPPSWFGSRGATRRKVYGPRRAPASVGRDARIAAAMAANAFRARRAGPIQVVGDF